MKRTLRVYFRPEPRCTQRAQENAAKNFDGKIIAYDNLDRWFSDMRHGDVVGVAFYHRLASTGEELSTVRERLKAKGVTVLELATGRQAAPGHDGDMVQETRDFQSRRGMTPAEAKRLGQLGAKASPVTKSRGERLPNEHAERILNDHETYPTLKLALHAINNATDARGKKFKQRWYPAHITRMVQAGKLNLKPRRSGPKVKI